MDNRIFLTYQKNLVSFIRNNWRLNKSRTIAPSFNIKRTDVVWMTRQDDVFQYIADAMGIEKADASTPGWFGKRLPACKKLISEMTSEEEQKLEMEIERMKRQGVPREIQNK
jgi:hypothetical protein